jgi:SagB-type dehydrogenase family enzyme
MRYLAFWLLPALTTALATVSFGQGDSLSIGPRFHHETEHNENGFVGRDISFGRSLPLYKTYPGQPIIKLPAPVSLTGTMSETLAGRRSIRSFANRPVTLPQLAALLSAADGLTHNSGNYALRSAPSGGALYPIDIYVVATGVDSLSEGIFYFRPADSSLVSFSAGGFGQRLAAAALDQEFIADAPVNLVLAARFERSTKKYADRGYRYAYMEAGAICQNIYLAATALRLGTVAVGAFIDRAVNDVIGLDGREEAALLIMPVGYPAGE